MKKPRLTSRARARLDQRFHAFGPVTRFTPPARGWIKGIRGALGMTTAQLAKRVQVKQPSIVDFENSEAKSTIELVTLRRVAEALNCTVVYALVPRKPLETMVRERARVFGRRRLESVEHSMLLENQKVSAKASAKVKAKQAEARLDEILRETNPRLFWD